MPLDKIRDVVLKDGQSAELTMVVAPEPDWRLRLCAFLNAPPQPQGPSLHHFLLTTELPGLQTRYFTMVRRGEIAGCVVTTDGTSVGYINSTFVPRPLRQLGIASSLMAALEDDFSRRGGRVRFLTTRTDSPPGRCSSGPAIERYGNGVGARGWRNTTEATLGMTTSRETRPGLGSRR